MRIGYLVHVCDHSDVVVSRVRVDVSERDAHMVMGVVLVLCASRDDWRDDSRVYRVDEEELNNQTQRGSK